MANPLIQQTDANTFDVYTSTEASADAYLDTLSDFAFERTPFRYANAQRGAGASGVTIRFTDDNELAKFLKEL